MNFTKSIFFFTSVYLATAHADLAQFEQRLIALEKQQARQSLAPTLRGQIQLDTAFYLEDRDVSKFERVVLEDAMSFRRVRLEARGDYAQRLGYVSQIDFAKNKGEIKNMWMSLRTGDSLIRVGNMKTPTFHEELSSSSNVGFLERGLGTNAFNYGRMTGLDFSGHSQKRFTYQVGTYTNSLASRAEFEKSVFAYGGRLTGLVWQKEKDLFHLGAHYMNSSQQKEVKFSTRPVSSVSPKSVFDTKVIANTHQSEVMGAEALVMVGKFRAIYEVAQAKALPRDYVNVDSFSFESHQLTLALTLLGNAREYNANTGVVGSLKSERDITQGGWGAFEVLTRLSQIDLNDKEGNLEIRGGKGQAVSVGLVWAMAANFQTVLDLSSTKLKESDHFADQKFQVAQMRFEVGF